MIKKFNLLIKGGLPYILPAILCFLSFSLKADFAASLIPRPLLEDANSVYRVNEMTIVFDGPESFTMRRNVVITILNENGKGPDILAMQYDGNSSPRFISGEIFDAQGRSITRIRRRDLIDQSNVSGFSLYEDNRIMGYIPRISSYPYTVSYEYEIRYNRGMYYAMTFLPHMAFNRSTQKASLSIEYPQNMELNYMEFNLDGVNSNKDNNRGRLKVTWDFDNLHAIRREHLSPALRYIAPQVIFAPDRFVFDGYAGSNNSWKDFGKWVWTLNEARDNLPRERVGQLNEMVRDMECDREKVKAIYEFLQSRTRYVNIALGIGGMQPFDAQTVDRTGYGDCKALTNYMMAMLRAVGIESYYTLVRAGVGSYGFVEEFSSNQFNHVILCVPLENDTIWLECTDQNLPFNHLGDFTDNRPVLLIREDGGKLVRTPAYNRDENINNSFTTVILDNRGNGTGSIRMDFGGIYFVDYMRTLRLSEEDQQRWLYRNIPLPNYSIDSHQISQSGDDNPIATIEMDVQLSPYASLTGQRLFVPLNLITAHRTTPPRIRNRQNPFVLSFDRCISDTIVFIIPERFELESQLSEQTFESEFGTFQTEFIIKDNEIWYIRRLQTNKGNFPPEKYQDFFRFYQNVARADGQSLTLVRR